MADNHMKLYCQRLNCFSGLNTKNICYTIIPEKRHNDKIEFCRRECDPYPHKYINTQPNIIYHNDI